MMKLFFRFIMAFALTFFGACGKTKAYEFIEEPEIYVSSCVVDNGKTREERWFEADIYGSMRNITDEDWISVSIVFTVFDADGNEVGLATAKMRNVEAGEIWGFCAVLEGNPLTKPATFKLKEVMIEDRFIYDYANSNEVSV